MLPFVYRIMVQGWPKCYYQKSVSLARFWLASNHMIDSFNTHSKIPNKIHFLMAFWAGPINVHWPLNLSADGILKPQKVHKNKNSVIKIAAIHGCASDATSDLSSVERGDWAVARGPTRDVAGSQRNEGWQRVRVRHQSARELLIQAGQKEVIFSTSSLSRLNGLLCCSRHLFCN